MDTVGKQRDSVCFMTKHWRNSTQISDAWQQKHAEQGERRRGRRKNRKQVKGQSPGRQMKNRTQLLSAGEISPWPLVTSHQMCQMNRPQHIQIRLLLYYRGHASCPDPQSKVIVMVIRPW